MHRMPHSHVRRVTSARARHLGTLPVQKANMLRTQVVSSALNVHLVSMQTQRLLSIARVVSQDSIRQRVAALHVLHVQEVNIVNRELLNALNVIWESMVETLPV